MAASPADLFGRVHAPTRAGNMARHLATLDRMARDEDAGVRALAYVMRTYLTTDRANLDKLLGISAPGSHITRARLAKRVRDGGT